MLQKLISFWGLLALLTLQHGCMATRHVAYETANTNTDMPLSRVVAYNIDRAFYLAAPDCVVVMPVETLSQRWPESGYWAQLALARHLSSKFHRVIGPQQRQLIAKRNALDMQMSLYALSEYFACPYFLKARPWSKQDTYMLFWTQIHAGLDVELINAKSDTVLWRARHAAQRSGGGLPLSPFSVAASIYSANQLSSDKEELISLIEATVRRMVDTLPNTRSYQIEIYKAYTNQGNVPDTSSVYHNK